jgi:hypothetical protein
MEPNSSKKRSPLAQSRPRQPSPPPSGTMLYETNSSNDDEDNGNHDQDRDQDLSLVTDGGAAPRLRPVSAKKTSPAPLATTPPASAPAIYDLVDKIPSPQPLASSLPPPLPQRHQQKSPRTSPPLTATVPAGSAPSPTPSASPSHFERPGSASVAGSLPGAVGGTSTALLDAGPSQQEGGGRWASEPNPHPALLTTNGLLGIGSETPENELEESMRSVSPLSVG